MQKCWRIVFGFEDKEQVQNQAASLASEWGNATIVNAYSKNPLDDFEDDDDEEY